MAAPIVAKVAVQVAQSKTGRRIILGVLALVLVIVMLPVILIGGAAMALTTAATENVETCTTGEAAGGFSAEQLGNAVAIRTVAADMEVPASGVKIAIMVALVESNLTNLANTGVPESLMAPNQGTPGSDHDSVGIMQQRPSAGWGTPSELMKPEFAARAFFGGPSGPNGGSPRGLLDIPGWESMKLGAAAQAVQVSAFPDRYEERAADADAVLAALGDTTTGCESGAGGGAPPKVVGGWANPIGMQSWGTYENHAGGAMDVHVDVGTPVYAPAAGKVFDLSEGCGGKVIGVQHDVQYTTAFAHMSSFAVAPGEHVKGGQLIGYSGASGSCVDGAHLHFEVRVGPDPTAWGTFTPAYKFMREQGITMGPCTTGCDLYPM
ncbi:M23 family metallopeptidase [Leucobacter chromiiresistens]|uniref:Peptidase family M23 n=1 Tax=Leucobacter chromiiresistens TaxID=1079994 RepID=A0A1H0ZYY3_9MICO|nr:M23 family metallopeptidase [Leucobacter chromiiresistens]SDQ32647.1 Peptidase family M23 [Leucobacter chromiiresistens]